ncbi:MAG: hypothetical protein OEL83_05000 [Desulforhopalus sp.]|nr:hypothetical protein [Desulforhopalus sp.]
MICCHLALLIGKNKMSICDVIRETRPESHTVTLMHKEKVDLEARDALSALFLCELGDLLERLVDIAANEPEHGASNP